MRFHTVPCCVCGSQEAAPFCTAVDRLHGVAGEFSYVTCRGCGLLYQNPQVVPDDIPQLYPESYAPWAQTVGIHPPPPQWKRALRDALVITGLPARVRARLAAGESLLDVGCGNGRFLARIRSEFPLVDAQGLDFSPQAVEAVRTGLGVTAHQGTLADCAGSIGPFDVITMWWYLEHVPDPGPVLELCRGLLKPGGYLAIGVPNARSVSRHVFRSRWFHLDPPRHLWIFDPKSLSALVRKAGLEVAKIRHDLSPWGILGSLQYAMRGRIEDVDSSWLTSRPLKLATRPLATAAGAAGWGDSIALYATTR